MRPTRPTVTAKTNKQYYINGKECVTIHAPKEHER